MDHTLEVKKSIKINCSVERIWEVMTTPSIIAKYLHGTETITTWEVDSEIIFQGEYEGQKYLDKGIVRKNEHLKELTYSYWSGFSGLEDIEDNYSLVSYLIHPESENSTIFTWKQKGYPDESRKEHSEGGMDALLSQIKEIAEEK